MLIAAIMGAMGGAAGVVSIRDENIISFAQQARITYMSNGSITALGDGLVGETWVTPANPSVAAGYEIRFSNATGDTSELIGSAFDTWLPLTSDRMVGVNPPQGFGTNTVSFTVQIRDRFSQLVRDSASVTLNSVVA